MAEQEREKTLAEVASSYGMHLGNRTKMVYRKKRRCPFSYPDSPAIDYKNPELLLKYMSERGKMLPRRITGVSAKNQRALSQAIKRARFLGLIPYVNQ